MKNIISTLIMFLSTYPSFAQTEKFRLFNTVEDYKYQAFAVMRILKIEMRLNVPKDSKIIFMEINDSKLNGLFFCTPDSVVNLKMPNLRYYKQPVIKLGPDVTYVLNNKALIKNKELLVAQAIVIHEFVHYFQKTLQPFYKGINQSDDNVENHLEPSEFEAYFTEAYFFMYYYNPDELKQVYDKFTDPMIRFKQLYNTYIKHAYNQPPLFK